MNLLQRITLIIGALYECSVPLHIFVPIKSHMPSGGFIAWDDYFYQRDVSDMRIYLFQAFIGRVVTLMLVFAFKENKKAKSEY